MQRTTSQLSTIALVLALATGCAGDDGGDDGASSPTTDADSSGDTDPTMSPTSATGSPTSATGSPTTDDATSSGEAETDATEGETTDETTDGGSAEDTATTGAADCGTPPDSCVAVAAREVECDPSLADVEQEIVDSCTCYAAGLDQSEACVAAFEEFQACVLEVSCEEISEPPCDDGPVIACEL